MNFQEFLINSGILLSLHELYFNGIDPGITIEEIEENYILNLIKEINDKIDFIINN